MSAPLVRLVSPDLALLEAGIDDLPPLRRALGCEVAKGWDVFPKALRLRATRSSPIQRSHRAGRVAASPPPPFASFCAKLFATPDVRTVLAHTLVEPSPSVRVLEKAGFVHQGDVPHDEVGRSRATGSTVRKHPGSTAGDVAKALDTVPANTWCRWLRAAS